VVALAALLPSWGTLAAPLLAEDGSILGYVHAHPLGADAFGSQYGLHTLAFWRPLVTGLWDVQESLGGASAAPLRAYNLLAHAACAVLASVLAGRLGLGRIGALAAGLWVASFPEQGGIVTWVSGRTDGTVAPLMLAACVLALDRRALAAAATAGLACAAKEMAFVLPAWVLALGWARGERGRALLRTALPVTAAVVAAFAWRHLALGAWIGGYPEDPGGEPAAVRLGRAAAALARGGGASWAGGAVLVALALVPLGRGAPVGRGEPARAGRRAALAGLALALTGAAPLLPLLLDGLLEPQNLRLLRVPDVALGLAAAAALGGAARAWAPAAARSVLVVALGLVAWRAREARADVVEWRHAGRVVQAELDRARALAERLGPAPTPVLVPGFPRLVGGAYALGFGVADRFRAPFEPSARPVWPLRTMFGFPGHERATLFGTVPVAPADPPTAPGALVVGSAPRRLPRLAVARSDAGDGPLRVDAEVAREPDRTLRLVLRSAAPAFEIVLYTELGYEPALVLASELPAAEGGRALSLRALFLRSNSRVTMGETLAQVADLGATRAYLELRELDERGEPTAVSDWIELVWAPDLLDRVDEVVAAAGAR